MMSMTDRRAWETLMQEIADQQRRRAREALYAAYASVIGILIWAAGVLAILAFWPPGTVTN